jgi:hypothetical protein
MTPEPMTPDEYKGSSGDPSPISLLLTQLQTLERSVNRRFDQQDEQLADIKAQTTRTNGRVTALESARHRAEGTIAAFRWVPAVLGALLTAGITILVMALSGTIK